MKKTPNAITMIVGLAMAGLVVFEIFHRRRQLREIYNVLEKKDKQMVADLEQMAKLGQLKPYTGKPA